MYGLNLMEKDFLELKVEFSAGRIQAYPDFDSDEVKLEEVFKICHEGVAGGHRVVAGTSDKFQRTFFMMSAREKIRRLVDRCNICLAKERSIQAKRGPHMPSTVGNVGEKVCIDLVSMSETVRKNRYM